MSEKCDGGRGPCQYRATGPRGEMECRTCGGSPPPPNEKPGGAELRDILADIRSLAPGTDEIARREAVSLAVDISDAQAFLPALRCVVTRNQCGTDTWMEGHPCRCAGCLPWRFGRRLISAAFDQQRMRKALEGLVEWVQRPEVQRAFLLDAFRLPVPEFVSKAGADVWAEARSALSPATQEGK